MWIKLNSCILVITQIATDNILLVHIFRSLKGSSHSSNPGYGATAGGNAGRGVRGVGGGGEGLRGSSPAAPTPVRWCPPKGRAERLRVFFRGQLNNSAKYSILFQTVEGVACSTCRRGLPTQYITHRVFGFDFARRFFQRFGGRHSFCLFIFLFTIHTFIQSFIHNIRWGPSPLLNSFRFSGRSLHGVQSRDSNSGLPYSKSAYYPRASELRCTLLIVTLCLYKGRPHRRSLLHCTHTARNEAATSLVALLKRTSAWEGIFDQKMIEDLKICLFFSSSIQQK